jgi:hypothetical protein
LVWASQYCVVLLRLLLALADLLSSGSFEV